MTAVPLRVTCAIIFWDGKIFAARRGNTTHQAFSWEFPGGKIEAGETEAECIVRELSEELNMKPVILERLPSFVHHYENFAIELIPFICDLPLQEHMAAEHEQTGWFTPAQLLELQWAPADVPVLEYVLEKVYPRYA